MNEQLIVKNFGPIKDATVDFKRVTVFIGPTGGGKSTLAKLAAIFGDRQYSFLDSLPMQKKSTSLTDYALTSHTKSDSRIELLADNTLKFLSIADGYVKGNFPDEILDEYFQEVEENDRLSADVQKIITAIIEKTNSSQAGESKISLKSAQSLLEEVKIRHQTLKNGMQERLYLYSSQYIPSERIFVPAIEYSWPGLMRDDIGLPKLLLNFANSFSLSRKSISELDIAFLNAKYLHINGRDFIKIPDRGEPMMLLETASGIQSVTPLLVLLEHLSRNTEQAQSFIIEEPELNLFPLAQFELVKILVEKCAQTVGKNDLVLTTHSPYVLTALNLLCYAYRIAQQDEATAKKVAKLIPRHCWIDPAQFAAYYVDRPDTKRKQQVRSIINKKTGLIEENELDTASDELGAIFDKLVRLRKPTQMPSRAK